MDALQTRAAEAKRAVQAATAETRDQLRKRIDQAQADIDLAVKDAQQQAGEAADSTRSKWAQMKADASAKMDDLKAKIDKRDTQLDASAAANDADWAEEDAARQPPTARNPCRSAAPSSAPRTRRESDLGIASCQVSRVPN
jgi:gas vesicle protein